MLLLKSQAAREPSIIRILWIQLELHIIYRQPLFNGDAADWTLITLLAASAERKLKKIITKGIKTHLKRQFLHNVNMGKLRGKQFFILFYFLTSGAAFTCP